MIALGKKINILFGCRNIRESDYFLDDTDRYHSKDAGMAKALSRLCNINDYVYTDLKKYKELDYTADQYDIYSFSSYKFVLDDKSKMDLISYKNKIYAEKNRRTTEEEIRQWFSKQLNIEVIGFYSTGHYYSTGLYDTHYDDFQCDDTYSTLRLITSENIKLVKYSNLKYCMLYKGPVLKLLNNLYIDSLKDIMSSLHCKLNTFKNGSDEYFLNNTSEVLSIDMSVYLKQIADNAVKNEIERLQKSQAFKQLLEFDKNANIKYETLNLDFSEMIKDLVLKNYNGNIIKQE